MSDELKPCPVELFCPQCGEQHIDEGEWATRPHKTHLCLFCKHEWRVSARPTVGVRRIAALPQPITAETVRRVLDAMGGLIGSGAKTDDWLDYEAIAHRANQQEEK